MKRKKHLLSLDLIVSRQFVSWIGYSDLVLALGCHLPVACAVRHFVTSSVMFTFVICYLRFNSLIFIEKPHVWTLRLRFIRNKNPSSFEWNKPWLNWCRNAEDIEVQNSTFKTKFFLQILTKIVSNAAFEIWITKMFIWVHSCSFFLSVVKLL